MTSCAVGHRFGAAAFWDIYHVFLANCLHVDTRNVRVRSALLKTRIRSYRPRGRCVLTCDDNVLFCSAGASHCDLTGNLLDERTSEGGNPASVIGVADLLREGLARIANVRRAALDHKSHPLANPISLIGRESLHLQ